MLKLLRNPKTKKQIYMVLAVAVISTFVLSGIYLGNEDKGRDTSVGRLNGRNITVQDYLASYKAIDHQARMMYGGNFDQIRQYLRIKEQAWDRLLFLNYAKKEGIQASDKEVVQWISRQPFLQTKGRFDERAYDLFVTQYLRQDARRFEEEIRDTLTIGKIQDKFETAIKVTDEELRELYAQKNGERRIQYVVYSLPSAEQPEISEEDLKTGYALYENYLLEPAKVRIRYVFVPKDKTEQFKDALKDNGTVDAVASKYKLEAVDTAYFTRNDAVPGLGLITEVIEKAFLMDPKKTSEWIGTDGGSYKIEVLDKKQAVQLTYEESKPQLKEILARQKSVEASVQKLTELSKDLKPEDFEKFASDQKLELQTFDRFKSGAYLPVIGPSEPLEKPLASVKEGALSKVIAVPSGAALVKVLQNTPIDEKKFAEEKEALRKEALDERSAEKMQGLLETLRRQLVPNMKVLKEILPEEEPLRV